MNMTGENRTVIVGYGRPGTGLDRKLWRQQPASISRRMKTNARRGLPINDE